MVKKSYKNFLLGIFIISCIILFNSKSYATEKEVQPKANNGVIDASNWDFNKNGSLKIDGEWRFYWNKLLSPSDINNGNYEYKFVKVPESWTNYANVSGIKKYGVATYSLTINTKRLDEIMAIKLHDVYTSARVWVNNKLLISMGTLSKDKNKAKPNSYPTIKYFKPEGNKISIVVQVSNYDFKESGMKNSLEIGTAEQINEKDQLNVNISLFIIGALFVMCIYHIALFMFRREEKSTLYFAIICIFTMLRSFITDNRFAYRIFHESLGWTVVSKLEYSELCMGGAIVLLFTYSVFKEGIRPQLPKFFMIVGTVLTVINLILPVEIDAVYILPVSQIIILIPVILSIVIIIKALKKGFMGSIFALIGIITVFVAGINDILYSDEILHTFYMIPFAILIFVFCQSLTLSAQFANAYKKLSVMFKSTQETSILLSSASDNVLGSIQNLVEGTKIQTDEILNVTRSVETLEKSAKAVMSNVQSQVSSSEEISATVNDFSVAIGDTVKNSESTKVFCMSTAQKARNSGEDIEKILIGINNIKDTVENIENKALILSKSSKEIVEIVATIKEISEQTNLLALNASIEAAKVGESGRGFAVVANSIKQLSDRASKSTKSIEEIILNIQNEIEDVIMETEKGFKEVQNSNELSIESTKRLKDIIEEVQIMSNEVEKISNIIKEKSDIVISINEAVNGIAVESTEIQKVSSEQLEVLNDVIYAVENVSVVIDNNKTETIIAEELSKNLADMSKKLNKIIKGELV